MIAALPASQPQMNAIPVGRGRSLCTTSAIAGSTENGESATTIASAVTSPSSDPQPPDIDSLSLSDFGVIARGERV